MSNSNMQGNKPSNSNFANTLSCTAMVISTTALVRRDHYVLASIVGLVALGGIFVSFILWRITREQANN